MHVWLYVEYPPSGGQTVGVVVGVLALVAMTLLGIGFHRKRTRKRKLNAILAKRYENAFHVFQHLTLKHCRELSKNVLGSQENSFFFLLRRLNISTNLIQVISGTFFDSWKFSNWTLTFYLRHHPSPPIFWCFEDRLVYLASDASAFVLDKN